MTLTSLFVISYMWKYKDDNKIFIGGQEDYINAETEAKGCLQFTLDYEEEWMDDEEVSCYNCRYRRWTEESFVCMKKD